MDLQPTNTKKRVAYADVKGTCVTSKRHSFCGLWLWALWAFPFDPLVSSSLNPGSIPKAAAGTAGTAGTTGTTTGAATVTGEGELRREAPGALDADDTAEDALAATEGTGDTSEEVEAGKGTEAGSDEEEEDEAAIDFAPVAGLTAVFEAVFALEVATGAVDLEAAALGRW